MFGVCPKIVIISGAESRFFAFRRYFRDGLKLQCVANGYYFMGVEELSLGKSLTVSLELVEVVRSVGGLNF